MVTVVGKVPMMSGGRSPKSVVLACATTLVEWEDLTAFLAAELPGQSWVVQPRAGVAADWEPKGRVLPYVKVRLEHSGLLTDELDAVQVPRLYVDWAQQKLRGLMVGAAERDTAEHHRHQLSRLRSIAFKILKHGMNQDLLDENRDSDQLRQVELLASQIENLDLGRHRGLNPSGRVDLSAK